MKKRDKREECHPVIVILIGFCMFFRCFLIGALISAFLPEDTKTIISDYMGIDVSCCEILQENDSHGGFHGDGQTFVELQATKAEFKHIVGKMTGQWKDFPLTENLSRVVYGGEEGSPLISREEDSSPLIPPIEEGYYYFTDRNSLSSDPADDSRLFKRYSWNFTLVICDKERSRIYYVEYDT